MTADQLLKSAKHLYWDYKVSEYQRINGERWRISWYENHVEEKVPVMEARSFHGFQIIVENVIRLHFSTDL